VLARQKPRRSRHGETDTGMNGQVGGDLSRIANLLALLLVKGESQTDKILTLTAAGFSGAEIATLLATTPNTVAVTLYQSKKKAGKLSKKQPAKSRE
jgi:DNA-binding CsgD family transcriptional regulator